MAEWLSRLPRLRRQVNSIPDGLWVKCPKCQELQYKRELEKALEVCPKCDHHFPLGAMTRIEVTVDPGSFEPIPDGLKTSDPLEFPGYTEKLDKAREESGLDEAILCGTATIGGVKVALAVTDFSFMAGSMASVLGERFVRLCEFAIRERLPIVTITGSGGGARMQEGVLSLMQMAKTSGAVARLHQAGIPYLVVLTDPTYAGVYASFVSLADILIAEPRARAGFAGKRVIQLGLKVNVPDEIHLAEFQHRHGMIDLVLRRSQIRPMLIRLLRIIAAKDGPLPALVVSSDES